MRKENAGLNLNEIDIFSLNKVITNENVESGKDLTMGIEYAQISEENKMNY